VRHLFPWRAAGRNQIGQELRELALLRLPPGSPENRLAGLVHSLGFLAVAGMVLTGPCCFSGYQRAALILLALRKARKSYTKCLLRWSGFSGEGTSPWRYCTSSWPETARPIGCLNSQMFKLS
jgi:hypothetical protein